jgi:deoxyribose-phosphate aldolase
MTRAELALMLDHSVLKPEATRGDILEGARVVREWKVGQYCVQPGWVRAACEALAGSNAAVASVIGFPHGCEPGEIKARAAEIAVRDGAHEIDMVIQFGRLKDGDRAAVAVDILAVVRAVPGIGVKAIIEARALTDAEKTLACRIALDCGVAFVKTSTGFHPTGGATAEDVRLMRDVVGPDVGVKASGGIRTLAEARAMLEAGANRIGTSASAAILGALPADR